MKQTKIGQKLFGSLCCVLAALIWGAAFVAQTSGMDYVGPFTFLGCRNLLAAAVLLPFALRAGKKQDGGFGTPGDWGERRVCGLPALIPLGFLSGCVLYAAMALQQYGLQYTTAGKSGFITAMYMVLVPVLRLFMGKRPGKLLTLCIALAAGGMYLLCMSGSDGGSINRGDLITMGCALVFAIEILVVDWLSPHFHPVQLSCMRFAAGTVVGLPLMLLTEGFHPEAVAAAALPILYAGVMSSGVAYTLQVTAQRITDPTVACLLMSLESVFSAVFGWLLLGQAMSPREGLGCVIMFAAILLCQLPGAAEAKENPEK